MLSLLLSVLLTFVEYNCENLFDCQHDSLKDDLQFMPEGTHKRTPGRYWRKLNHISQAILSCGGDSATATIPDLIALTEVENDSVMRDLTKRSALISRTVTVDDIFASINYLLGLEDRKSVV